jgi:gluconolactonase
MMIRSLKYRLSRMLLAALIFGSISNHAGGESAPAHRKFALIASRPAFWALIHHDAVLRTMGSGFGFTEGPVWDKAGFLWVSDEELNKLFRLYPDGHREEVASLGDPDGNTYDRAHRLLDCASVLRSVIRFSSDGKGYTPIAERYQGKRFNSPNDIVLGPDGAFYFTDPTLDLPKGQTQEIPFQGVYRVDGAGKVTLLTQSLTQPNGLAFSPDGERLYVDDSAKKVIWVFRFHRDGTISDGRIFGTEAGPENAGVPDGMRVDTSGNLFVVGPKGIWIWSAKGVHLGTIVVPEQPANLAWGGKNNSTLFITATTSVYTIETSTEGFVPYE